MSVYKRGSIWWAHIEVAGRVIRRSTKQKEKKKAQEVEAKWRARLHDDLYAGMVGRAPKRTFEEALVRWIDGDATQLKSYDNILDKAGIVLPYFTGVQLKDSPEKAEEMKQVFISEGLKPATINRRLAIVKRVLRLSYKWGWLDSPIHSKIELLPENNERHIYLTREQVYALADAAGIARDAILALAFTGLRKSEMLRVTQDNVVNSCIVLDSNTKSGKPRVVPIPAEISHIKFPITLTEHELRTSWDQARETCDLGYLHLHDLRHSYASMLISANAPLAAVKELLGHAHLGVTSRYAHLETNQLRSIIDSTFTAQYESKKPELKEVKK